MKMKLTGLSTDTLAELVKRVLSISQKEAYVMVQNHPLLVSLTDATAPYMDVFDKQTFSGKGQLVAKADLQRDNLYLGLKNIIMGIMQLDGLPTQQDAVDLYSVFNAHGLDLYRYSYGDESSHLEKLIEDLEKAENKAKLEQLHLTASFDLMKAAQQSFQLIFNEQTSANAELRGKESATSLQGNLISTLRNYLNYVDVMSTFDTAWSGLALELNEALKAAANSKQATKPLASTAPATK